MEEVDDTYLGLFEQLALKVGRQDSEVYFEDLMEHVDVLATQLEVASPEVKASLESYGGERSGQLSYESFFAIISYLLDSQVSKQVAGEFLEQMARSAGKLRTQEVQEEQEENDDLLDFLAKQEAEEDDEEVRRLLESKSSGRQQQQAHGFTGILPISESIVSSQQGQMVQPQHQDVEVQQRGVRDARVTGNSHLSIADKRRLNLREIYEFYCKQTYVQGKHATFDRLKLESTVMSLGKFMYFCRDFGLIDFDVNANDRAQQMLAIAKQKLEVVKKEDTVQAAQVKKKKAKQQPKSSVLTKFVLVEQFKKTSSNNRDLSINELELVLQRVGEAIFLKRLVLACGYRKIKEVPEQSLSPLKNQSHEMVFQLLELHDLGKCRKRMKLVRKAFNMKDDTQRVKADELKYKFQLYNPNESNQEVLKAELEKRKEEKLKLKQLEKEKRDFFKLQQLLKFHNALQLEEMFPEKRELIHKIIKLRSQEREKLKQKMRQKSQSVPREANQHAEVEEAEEEEEAQKQLTWEGVKKITYRDLKNDYKPFALLNQIVASADDEDEIYLAEYQIKKSDIGPQKKKVDQPPKPTPLANQIPQSGSYSAAYRKQSQRSQSMKRGDQGDQKTQQIRENYGILPDKSVVEGDISLIEPVQKRRSISNYQPPTPYHHEPFGASHGGQGSYAMNIQPSDYASRNRQLVNTNAQSIEMSYINGQNQNHLKLKVRHQEIVNIKASPKKSQVNISQNTLARAKELEFEQLQKEKQLLSQMVLQQNNKMGRLQLKRSGYY